MPGATAPTCAPTTATSAPTVPAPRNAQFKQWALGLVKDHPATWGFYVGDELSPTSQNVSQTKALAKR